MAGTQASYEKMLARVAGKLEKAVERLERTGNVDRFAQEFSECLEEAHLGAVYEGRVLAGVRGQIDDVDRRLAQELGDRHAEFAERFLDDIDDGRYGKQGDWSGAGIRNRAYMYLETVRGTANESLVVNSADDELWDWILGRGEHCEDCKFMAKASPLRTDELWTQPGGGETDCRSKCKCRLRRKSDGRTGFSKVDIRAIIAGRPGSSQEDDDDQSIAASA